MFHPNQPNDVSWKSRVKGSILGSAVGDALGVPVEFKSRAAVAAAPVTGMRGWGTHNQPPGTWSDDTSMTLCMLESITEKGWDIDDQAVRFTRWLTRAHLTAHDEVFDVGRSTVQALERIADGYAALDAGCFEEDSNGNGSLMRNLPSALYCAFACTDVETAERIGNSSAITHAHPRSRLGCVIHALIAAELLEGEGRREAVTKAEERLGVLRTSGVLPVEMRNEIPQYNFTFHGNLALADQSEISSSGYIVHTLEATIWCLLTSSSFDDCVLKAVNLGDDTDTTATVAGGLAGLYWGYEGIPEEWLGTLVKSEMIDAMTTDFIASIEGGAAGKGSE